MTDGEFMIGCGLIVLLMAVGGFLIESKKDNKE